jgi:hypothetical protein
LRARNGQYELPGPFAVDLAYRVREGWAPEALDEFPETVTQATPGEVRAVLAGCRASEVYEFLGDAKVVKAGVAASGLGARVELELVKVPVASAPELVDDP